VSIAAAAATTAHIHMSAEEAAMYIPLSAAAAAHNPRLAALRLISVFFGGSRRIRYRSFHAMGTSVYKCDCRTYRQWTIHVCPMVRSQYQTHDDSQARSDLKVLW
jgi:hypothetical protein